MSSNTVKRRALAAVSGAAVGAVNGIFGGGGGMIVVPLLTAAGKPPLVAHATAILVILPVSLVSAAVYLFYGRFDLELFLAVTLGVVPGGMLGAQLLSRISPAAAMAVFAAVMFAAGVRMIL